MVQATRAVPVEHVPAISEIAAQGPAETAELQLTLLDLVSAISEVSDCEREVVATVMHVLRSGRVRLARPDAKPELPLAAD